MVAMWEFGGLVNEAAGGFDNEAAEKGVGDAANPSTVLCCGVRSPVAFPGSSLVMSCDPGDQFVTLDQPFAINMEPNECIQWDRPGAVDVIFCLKYKIGGEHGVTLEKSGLCFLQFMSTESHYTNLLTLAAAMNAICSGPV